MEIVKCMALFCILYNSAVTITSPEEILFLSKRIKKLRTYVLHIKYVRTRLPGAVPHQIKLFFIEFDLDWIDFGFIEFG